MTKKDYRAIADALRDMKDTPGFEKFLNRLMNVLATDNPRFDYQRFLHYLSTGKDQRYRRS